MADATAVQPDISLGVRPPAISAGNPLTTLGTLSEVQNRLNANRLFQQEFNAKQLAGQIISQAPDLETGMSQLYQDPNVAAFAPGIINNIRQSQSTMMDIATKQQALNTSALGTVLHNMGASLASGDVSGLSDSINAGLATVPREAQAATRSAVGSLVKSLGEDLPADPQQAHSVLQKRAAALMLQSGFTPDSVAAAMGTTLPAVTFQNVGLGGASVPVQTGGFGGGVNIPVSVAGGNTLAPAAPQPAAPVQGLSQAQQQFQADRGKNMAQYMSELDDAVKTGNTLMQTIQEGREALKDFKPGGGAGVYAHIAQVAQAFGAPNDLVDRISNGDLSASQEFSKIANNFVTGQLRQALQGIGGSRINQQEWSAFQKNNPNLETDPRAIEKIFTFWSRQHNYNVAEQQAMAEAMQRPGFDVTTWPAQWQKIAQSRGMVNVGVSEAGTQRPAATNVTKHWIIQDGKLVPAGQPAPAAAGVQPNTMGTDF